MLQAKLNPSLPLVVFVKSFVTATRKVTNTLLVQEKERLGRSVPSDELCEPLTIISIYFYIDITDSLPRGEKPRVWEKDLSSQKER